ncbi:hypothetical protein KY333_05135 [Candidatus Woesearchaeota archaeon]|nr:hypothetical protein [Candidatus Woesearchaeota archaeon]
MEWNIYIGYFLVFLGVVADQFTTLNHLKIRTKELRSFEKALNEESSFLVQEAYRKNGLTWTAWFPYELLGFLFMSFLASISILGTWGVFFFASCSAGVALNNIMKTYLKAKGKTILIILFILSISLWFILATLTGEVTKYSVVTGMFIVMLFLYTCSEFFQGKLKRIIHHHSKP